ncbi:hypothetical protein SESBI_41206 [Sesbania bispinosa]|nr:hypothetical protein SESBI_41206 [Sesbania bispinosa]
MDPTQNTFLWLLDEKCGEMGRRLRSTHHHISTFSSNGSTSPLAHLLIPTQTPEQAP